MIFKIFKIFASNIFSFGGLLESIKKGPKEVVKNVIIILLLLYAFGAFGFMYINSMLGLYKYLSMSGQTSLMPFMALLMEAFITFFFGFTSVASNYYTGSGDEQLLSMPITAGQLFSAKFAVSFLTDAVLGLLIFAIATVIYGYNEKLLANPMFYLGTLITAVTFATLAIIIIYFLFIGILLLAPALRKKSFLNGIASFFVIIFVIVFSYGSSMLSVANSLNDVEGLERTLAPAVGMIVSVSGSFSFLSFFAEAIHGKVLPLFVMVAILALCVFVLIPVAGKLYIKTLNGFADIKSKKLSSEKVTEVINKDVHAQSIFKAVFWRDVKTVLREPTFFANGPLMVFLMPVIFIVSASFSFIQISGGVSNLYKFRGEILTFFLEASPEKLQKLNYLISVIAAGCAVFIGNCSSMAVSSFSREGKSLYDLKAMPIQNNIIIKAKFFHAFVYVVIADIITCGFLGVIMLVLEVPYSFLQAVQILGNISLLNFAISLVLIFIDMFIDTAHPKLQWENPIAAFKQNLNSVFGIFISIGVIGFIIALGLLLLPKNEAGVLVITAVFGTVGAILGANYFRYAEKRIPEM